MSPCDDVSETYMYFVSICSKETYDSARHMEVVVKKLKEYKENSDGYLVWCFVYFVPQKRTANLIVISVAPSG